jgi:LPS-assembly lipoprotein
MSRAGATRRSLLTGGAACLAALPLAGCGFHPLYMPTVSGRPGIAQRELAAISVAIIPDRPGQLLRQALQDRFDAADAGVQRRYDLAVDYGIAADILGVQADSSITRVRVIGRASWTLRGQDPLRTMVTNGSARSIDAYNILDQQFFAADLENESAQRRLADAVADQITAQLAAFFRKRTITPA